MNTCKDCKWWNDIHKRIKGECSEIGQRGLISHPEIPYKTIYSYETFKDFGCIHWEKKE
ncbi:hypothetical protein LCGC14_0650260 [marine sediment metagenome]|uniref:Uncharacterized protein n=1 Tax=marine sediment metagenome TaxID=412755 RepID=A0A0F9RG96_9ZZZZ